MTKLRSSRRNKLALILVLWPAWLHAVAAGTLSGDWTLTKTLIGGSGVNQVATPTNDYTAAFSLGEDVAGTESKSANFDFVSGYFSGYASGATGTFQLLGGVVGSTQIYENGFQVGVPLNAPVQLLFSNPVAPSSVPGGIQVVSIMDHMGQAENNLALWTSSYTVAGTTVTIYPQGAWQGNSIYDISGTPSLRSVDGFALSASPHVQFLTLMDPNQENIVLNPLPLSNGVIGAAATSAPTLTLDIPQNALNNYAYVLVSQDPVHSPLQVNPATLTAATQKAQISGGPYQTPLAYQEIVAYNQTGQAVSLSKGATLSITYSGTSGLLSGTNVPIRADTLSLWALDSVHALWVKMPDSRLSGSGVAGGMSQFSVYALMGSAATDTSDVFVFPNPWRPHGPNAGTGPGQTGSDSGGPGSGITFSNIPSECTIKIYTLSGELVRQIHHSDLVGPPGQENWDGNTSGGTHAASGVYLWRVESSTDGKNGKLMIIR
jgi:hypothetical protein